MQESSKGQKEVKFSSLEAACSSNEQSSTGRYEPAAIFIPLPRFERSSQSSLFHGLGGPSEKTRSTSSQGEYLPEPETKPSKSSITSVQNTSEALLVGNDILTPSLCKLYLSQQLYHVPSDTSYAINTEQFIAEKHGAVMNNPTDETGQNSSWMLPYQSSELINPIPETSLARVPHSLSTITKILPEAMQTRVIGGPYLHPDASFKDNDWFNKQRFTDGVVLYAATEQVYKIKKGRCLGRKAVYLSQNQKFVLKKRKYIKKNLDSWKHLPTCANIVPLVGIITAESGNIYKITHRMDCTLREAQNHVTLKDLASRQRNDRWAKIISKYSHIIRSILMGTIHLNDHGYQHYDLKEDNIFVNKPQECQCYSILECTCRDNWEIRIGDFDTLWPIKRPDDWGKCGTKYYRPPEAKENSYNLHYTNPTYDSWSIMVVFLHFCCGTPREVERVICQSPYLQHTGYYANYLLRDLCEASTTNSRLAPLMKFATTCLEESHVMRPTPQAMLKIWDTKVCM